MSKLQLKRTIRVKAIVTPLWKQEMHENLQRQISEIDRQDKQIDADTRQAIAQMQSPEQINALNAYANGEKSKLLAKKNEILQNIQNVQNLALEEEVDQFDIEGVFEAEVGENLISKLQVEVVLRDGVIIETRGEI